MTTSEAAFPPVCGDCDTPFEASIAVFVLDALAPTVEQTPLTRAGEFGELLFDTAVRACTGMTTSPDVEAFATGPYCLAAAHLVKYAPTSNSAGADEPPRLPGCGWPRQAALDALGEMLVTQPERGLALLRRAADDYHAFSQQRRGR